MNTPSTDIHHHSVEKKGRLLRAVRPVRALLKQQLAALLLLSRRSERWTQLRAAQWNALTGALLKEWKVVRVAVGILAVAGTFCGAVQEAQAVTPLGSEFRANNLITGNQTYSDVALSTNGDFVVTWEDSNAGGDIYFRKFNNAGVPLTSDLNATNKLDAQLNPAIGMAESGDFVLAWTENTGGTNQEVYALRFNPAGGSLGNLLHVNTGSIGTQNAADIAVDKDGDFVVVWQSENSPGDTQGYGISAQRYSKSGSKLGGEFRVNSYMVGAQTRPQVGMAANGDFIVTWESADGDGDGPTVYAQRYNAAGTAQGAEFIVNSNTAGAQDTPAIAVRPNGDFNIVWRGPSGGGTGILGQRYSAGGSTLGGEFVVSIDTINSKFAPAIGMDADGQFVVAWDSNGQDGSNSGIFARRYDILGTSLTSEFQVNTYTLNAQALPSVALRKGGDFVIIWNSYNQAGDGNEVYAQRFNQNYNPFLNTVGNKVIDETSALNFKATATDANSPTNTLSFSLITPPSGASINSGSGDFTWTPTEAQGGTNYTFKIQVSDGQTNDSEQITVTVNEKNAVPSLASISNKQVDENALLTFSAVATDSDFPTNNLTFGIINPPPGSTLNAGSGLFNWTPGEANGGFTNYVRIKVTDNGVPALSSTQNFSISVKEVNLPPTVAPISQKNVNEGSLLSFSVSASDADAPTNTLTFLLQNAPPGANINTGSGLFTWTPSESQGPSSNVMSVVVMDNGFPFQMVTQTFAVVVAEVNSVPTLPGIGDQFISEGTPLNVTAFASDFDAPTNTLTYSLLTFPVGASINSGSGAMSWTPSEAYGGTTNFVRIKVADNGVPILSATQSFKVMVSEVNNAPTLSAVSAQNVNEGSALNFTLTAVDTDAPTNSLTFFLLSPPAGVTVNSGSGAFSWTPTEAQGPSTNSIRAVVMDNGLPALSATQTITVTVAELNTAPTLSAISDKTVPEQSLLSFSAVGSDSDSPTNKLSYGLLNGLSGMALDSGSGAFTWTPSETQGPSTNLVKITLTDDGTPTLSVTQSFTIVVNDANAAPVLAAVGNRSGDELTALDFTVSATDSDLPANTLTYSLLGAPVGAEITVAGEFLWTPTEAQGPSNYVITIVVSDGITNDSEQITVTVNEVNMSPLFGPPADQSVAELDPLTLALVASDDDVPANTLSYALLAPPSGASIDSGSGLFSWTPVEAQGPSTNLLSVVVTDNGSPALSVTQSFTVAVAEQNSAPDLSSIGNQTVTVLQTLNLVAAASDTDFPTNTLTYSLINAPAGAVIDSGTGFFSWTPDVGQAAQNFIFSISVSDGFTTDEEEIAVSVTAPAGEPALRVLGKNLALVNGSTSPSTTNGTDFGAAVVGGLTVTRVFKLANESPDTVLNVSAVTVSGSGFTLSRLPISLYAPGTNDEFWINFAPTAAAVSTGVVSITSNDADDNPFTFAIAAVGVTQSSPTNTAPPPLPSRGALQVALSPTGAITAGAKWRPVGTVQWLESGGTLQNLQATNITLEFRPALGYFTPTNASLLILASTTTLYTATYDVQPDAQTGSFTVQLLPAGLSGAGWYLEGDASGLHLDGEVVSGLPAGAGTIRFADVAGYETPASRNVQVLTNELSEITGIYIPRLLAAAAPEKVPGLGITNTPFAFNGQITTDVGSGSGFVVTEQAVFTAAHVIFSDFYLSYKTGVRWLFRRQAGLYEPSPLEPRGMVVFGGYATARGRDLATLSSGATEFSPESRNADVATLYFPEKPGQGGFGGFLPSDSALNEWLTSSADKQLVGYTSPGPGIDATNSGSLFFTPAGNYSFDRLNNRALDADGDPNRVYVSSSFQGNEGMAGGPLYVDLAGTYFPAAVYLGTDAERSYVRSVDRNLLLLISVAQAQARSRAALPLGGARLSGGVIVVNPPGSGSVNLLFGSIRTVLSPAAATALGARWGVAGRSGWKASGSPMQGLPVAEYTVQFRAADGLGSPAPIEDVRVTANQTKLLSATYSGTAPQIPAAGAGVTLLKSKINLKWKPVASADFNNDGSTDLLLQNGIALRIQFFQGAATNGLSAITGVPKTAGWKVIGAADVDRDGRPDLLRRKGKLNEVLYLQGTAVQTNTAISDRAVKKGNVITVGDFNADGRPDLLRKIGKVTSLMFLKGASNIANAALGGSLPATKGWKIITSGDLGGDTQPDLVTLRKNFIGGWVLEGTNVSTAGYLSGDKTNPRYKIIGTGDFDQDNIADIIRLRADTINLLQTNQVRSTAPGN